MNIESTTGAPEAAPSPEAAESSQFDAAFEAAMGTPEAESAPEAIVDAPGEAPAVEAQPEVAAEPVVEPPKASDEGEQLQKIRKLMDFEAEKRKFEESRKAWEAEKAQIEAAKQSIEQERQSFKYNRLGYLKKLDPNLDLAALAKEAWYEHLGQEAPPEHRSRQEVNEVKSEIERLRNELNEERQRLAEQQQHQAREQAVQQYKGSISAYVSAVPEKLGLIRAYAQKDSAGVAEQLFEIASQHAQRTGEVLTPEQAAERLESQLSKYRSIMVPEQKTVPAPTKSQQVSTSLRNKNTAVQSNLAHQEPSDEVRFQEAVEAALGLGN